VRSFGNKIPSFNRGFDFFDQVHNR
jgi:hypothetical protein